MTMMLEDDFTDIVKKARNGQGLSVAEVAKRSGLDDGTVSDLERGRRAATEKEAKAVAQALGLRESPLADIAGQRWRPDDVPASLVEVKTILGDIGGYEVKGYLLCDMAAQEAVAIDTGYNSGAMLAALADAGLKLTAVCLTHGHTDHAGGLDRLLARWPVPVYLGAGDRALAPWLPSGGQLIDPPDGTKVTVGSLTVECTTTPGHTPGGMCYRVRTPTNDVCFVGDTLFAGSIGRSNPFSLYSAHLESVRTRLMALSTRTILLPGHGPATSVVEELEHNPFVAEV